MKLRATPVLALWLVASACGGETPPPPGSPVAAPSAGVGRPLERQAAGPTTSPRPRFENPGGMWMPHQMAAHAAKLKELGLEIDPHELSDPTSHVLSAVVSLGGCSASFVSAEGLVITNHHCATGALQYNSTPDKNLLKDGFLAASRADERWNGPQARVYVTRAVTDVTPKILTGLEAIADDRAREKELERRQKDEVAACEKGRAGTHCTVASFYEGASYYLVEQLEIRDVRLVWAPPAGVGNFGGEIDNWRWPRHAGDVSIFRAYVGKDGQPADHAEGNVPYRPSSWLKIARAPLREGDLVFVAGYPGKTATLKTKAEVDQAVSWGYPLRQKLYEDYLARIDEITKGDKDAQIRATSYVRRFANALTNTKGQLEGLVRGGLAEKKAEEERALRAFIDADEKRKAAWGAALGDVERALADNAATRDADTLVRDELHLPKLLGAALDIAKMAEERPKADADRDPDYQQRNWARHDQALAQLGASYHKKVDQGLVALALERAARAPDKGSAAIVALVTKDTTPAGVAKAVGALYAGTKLDDEKTRLDLFDHATSATLKASKDPLVQLALALRPLERAAEERADRLAGRLAVAKPKIIEAMRAARPEPFAPDANGTLRLTYGTVRGYAPRPDAPVYRPFTLLSEVVAKHKGEAPFDVPAPVLAAAKSKRFGPYVDERLGDVPVDFLADLHITGGNSGSATLDARGDLVGLVFDGNYEAMASDWVFVPSVTRSIHVDVRYVTWLLDAVFGGDALLKEMGVTPRVD